MRLIGLTGGIASGKSTVARVFERLGARLIDADRVAREVVEPGTPAYEAIVREFGEEARVGPGGPLDRARLRGLAFANPERKARLEAIVHPAVLATMAARIQEAGQADPEAIVVLDIPLLYETQGERLVEAVVVVYAPRQEQVARLVARDGLGEAEADRMVGLQMSLDEKCRRAPWVVWNAGPIADTEGQAEQIWGELRSRPAEARGGTSPSP